MTKSKKAEAKWHGQDKQEAIKRAKRIDGYVIFSAPPDSDGSAACDAPRETFGYWSDTLGFCRNWEEQVWPTR